MDRDVSMARLVRPDHSKKGSWEFARQRTLGYNNPVDPLQSLAVMAAKKVAEHMPTEEDGKLAPHHVALINNTGMKRRTLGGTDRTKSSFQTEENKEGRKGNHVH